MVQVSTTLSLAETAVAIQNERLGVALLLLTEHAGVQSDIIPPDK